MKIKSAELLTKGQLLINNVAIRLHEKSLIVDLLQGDTLSYFGLQDGTIQIVEELLGVKTLGPFEKFRAIDPYGRRVNRQNLANTPSMLITNGRYYNMHGYPDDEQLNAFPRISTEHSRRYSLMFWPDIREYPQQHDLVVQSLDPVILGKTQKFCLAVNRALRLQASMAGLTFAACDKAGFIELDTAAKFMHSNESPNVVASHIIEAARKNGRTYVDPLRPRGLLRTASATPYYTVPWLKEVK